MRLRILSALLESLRRELLAVSLETTASLVDDLHGSVVDPLRSMDSVKSF